MKIHKAVLFILDSVFLSNSTMVYIVTATIIKNIRCFIILIGIKLLRGSIRIMRIYNDKDTKKELVFAYVVDTVSSRNVTIIILIFAKTSF